MENLSQLADILESPDFIQFLRQSHLNQKENFSEFVEYLYESIDEAIQDIQKNKEYHLVEDEKNGGLKIQSEDSVTYSICLFLRSRKILAEHDAASNGNPDIKVLWKNNTWLGEAKIVHSNADSMEGWKQLVDRYSTGEPSDSYGGLLLYYPTPNVLKQIEGWKTFLSDREALSSVKECCKRPEMSFLTEIEHPVSQASYIVRHMPVMLHFAPTDKSARASKKHKAS